MLCRYDYKIKELTHDRSIDQPIYIYTKYISIIACGFRSGLSILTSVIVLLYYRLISVFGIHIFCSMHLYKALLGMKNSTTMDALIPMERCRSVVESSLDDDDVVVRCIKA